MAKDTLIRVNRDQLQASDPKLSVWVKANAGSGKTHVLILRILRLMLLGVDPSKILCVTFTRNAAANMRDKLFELLRKLSVLDDAELIHELAIIDGGHSNQNTLNNARRLFLQALDTPGGLRIQTIHAFAESILRIFPLEAGIPPSFHTIEDDDFKVIFDDLYLKVISNPAQYGDEKFIESVHRLSVKIYEKNLKQKVQNLISKNKNLRNQTFENIENIETQLLELLEVPKGLSIDAIVNSILTHRLNDDELRLISSLKTSRTKAVECFLNQPDDANLYLSIFMTSKQEKFLDLGYLIAQADAKKFPILEDKIIKELERLNGLNPQKISLEMARTNSDLLKLSLILAQLLQQEKSRIGALSYDDLIERLRNLFYNSSAEWIRYKLDYSIDHILVDEAQDTNPLQWDILQKIAEEFYSGIGTKGTTNRTVFAVGDEKQSIFRFQGAEPKAFEATGQFFEKKFGETFFKIPLKTSFRSSPAVLKAVDQCFSIPEHYSGLTAVPSATAHDSSKHNAAGAVEFWPVNYLKNTGSKTDWVDFSSTSEAVEPSAAEKLAQIIVDQIGQWIHNKIELPNENRPIEPSDILILVRKRDKLFHSILRGLQSAGLDVAGADRLKLLEFIAVKDLIALAKAMVCIDDDLSLAAALKSPLFRCDDDDLLVLTAEDCGIWRALLNSTDLKYQNIYRDLITLKEYATDCTPFRFFHRVLKEKEGLKKFRTYMGDQVCDPLESFLELIQNLENNGTVSLPRALHALAQRDIEIKRDMESNSGQIRVMTVHAAKGLEAPIVINTESLISTNVPQDELLPISLKGQTYYINKPNSKEMPEALLPFYQDYKNENENEGKRLAYVSMTRAQSVMILSGFDKLDKDGNNLQNSWMSLWKKSPIEFSPFQLQSLRDAKINPEPQTDMHFEMEQIQQWKSRHFENPNQVVAAKEVRNIDTEFGIMVHKLAEALPLLETELMQKMDILWPQLEFTTKQNALSQLMWLQNQKDLEFLFRKNSKTEVAYQIRDASKGVRNRRMDRIAYDDEHLHILDIKTGSIQNMSSAKQQIIEYANAMKTMFPDKKVTCFLAFCSEQSLVRIENSELMKYYFTQNPLTNAR